MHHKETINNRYNSFFFLDIDTIVKGCMIAMEQYSDILILGGYGYGNVGDEAQLNYCLKRLRRLFPNSSIQILSPDPEYTKSTHDYWNVDWAPRSIFFDENRSHLYSISTYQIQRGFLWNFMNCILKFIFLVRSTRIYYSAKQIKEKGTSIFVNNNYTTLIKKIAKSKMIYFTGGGYLTGATLSRLWDGILVCRLASLFNVPVVMSGQTIGVWDTSFNKRYAFLGFQSIKLITLRDSLFSPHALLELGISGNNIYPVCDDALFCDYQTNDQIFNKLLYTSNIKKDFIQEGYIVINFHYWGAISKNEKQQILRDINTIISLTLTSTKMNIILLPMTPSDTIAMDDYLKQFANQQVKLFKYSFDFKDARRLIKGAYMCITMKHHPIIFAAGEKVPVISVNQSSYYEHKNRGALNILGIEDFSISLDDPNHVEKIMSLINQVGLQRDSIVKHIDNVLRNIRKDVFRFETDLKNVWEISNECK